MPDGTIQDLRSLPSGAAGITWGYLKVKNPNLLRNTENNDCAWKEYMLFLNLSGTSIGTGQDREFTVETANLDFDGNSKLIEIAVIRASPGIPDVVIRPDLIRPGPFRSV